MAGAGALTFEKKGHEGDEGRGELGEGQTVHSVVPRGVLEGRSHSERGRVPHTMTYHVPQHNQMPTRQGEAVCTVLGAQPPLGPRSPQGRLCGRQRGLEL